MQGLLHREPKFAEQFLAHLLDGEAQIRERAGLDGVDRFGLREYFEFAFSSCYLGLRKPEPAIYEHVERATGLAPSALLFFDDAAPNIAAARRTPSSGARLDPA